MSKFTLIKQLLEARDKNASYSFKEVKGKIDRVIADLKGKQSAEWTKLSKQYIELDDSLKELSDKRDKLNAELKEKATDLFDAEDEVLTRVIETAQLTLTLSKQTKKPAEEKVDSEAVLKALVEAKLPLKIINMINELKEAHTKLTKETVTPEKLTVKRVEEDFSIKSLGAFISKVVGRLKGMLSSFDSSFDRVKKKVTMLESMDQSIVESTELTQDQVVKNFVTRLKDKGYGEVSDYEAQYYLFGGAPSFMKTPDALAELNPRNREDFNFDDLEKMGLLTKEECEACWNNFS